MDNSKELQQALNELYCSVIKVMSLVNPDTVDSQMRREAIARAIDNLLLKLPNQQGNPVQQVMQQPEKQKNHVQQPVMPQPVPVPVSSPTETRYCNNPTTDDESDWVLRRASAAKKEGCFYKLNISGDTGTFEVMEISGNDLRTYISAIQTMLPEGAVKIEGETSNAKRLVTTAPGHIAKKSNYWKILDKATVRFCD